MTETPSTTARVWLRPIRPDDASVLARATHFECDPQVRTPRIPLSAASFRSWIDGLDDRERVFAICRTGSDDIIGTTSLRAIDRHCRTAETGIGLLFGDDRGQGLGAEAKRLLLDIAFADLGLHAVHCTIAADNVRSIRGVEAHGYRMAGRLTNARGDGAPDTLYYDLLRSDWESRRG